VKVCKRCLLAKDLTAFSRDRTRVGGRAHTCKTCVAETRPSRVGSETSKKYWQTFYAARKDAILAAQREDENRRQRARDYYAEHGERLRARQQQIQRTPEGQAAHAARQKRRVAAIARATPAWLSPEQKAQIAHTYWHAKDASLVTGESYHVDHVAPLQGRLVCGLHVPWNLRVVPADVNLRKHTRLEGV
jgi:hypothetical protein